MAYQKGQPDVSSPQLPQGGATQANEAVPEPQVPLDIPVQYASPQDEGPEIPDSSLNDNMQILTAPPDPNYGTRMQPPDRPGRMPRFVIRHLPSIMAASKDPEAPETMKAMYRMIVDELEKENREGQV